MEMIDVLKELAGLSNKSPEVAKAIEQVQKTNPADVKEENSLVAGKSEYVNKLHDIEYKDAPKVNAEDFHSTNANMSLLKELLKDREKNDNPKEKENIQSKEEKGTPSPLTNANKGK